MGTPQMRAKISIPSITVNGVIVPVLNEPVGNLGAVFDPNMNMSGHVSKVIKSANYHLRNIGKIRKFLNTDTTKSAIVSLVTSRLDHCNGLLCGVTDELLCRLQKDQNNAARVVSGSRKYDHITPVLKDLHWLHIRKRIEFKILLLTFKCMQGCAPLYLRELLVKQANTRTLRSNTKNLLQIPLRPLQFNYLSYELFLEKKSCQTPKKKEKKVIFGVLRTKVVLKFSVRLKKKKKKVQVFKNILCKCDSINYRKLSLL